MGKKVDFILIVVVAVLVACGVWSIRSRNSTEAPAKEQGKIVVIGARSGGEKPQHKRGRMRRTRSGELVDESVASKRPVLDDVDESELNTLQKAVLDELQSALDDDSLEGVRKAIARFKAPKSSGGLDGDVPKVMRSHAVSALGWFGSSAVSDLMDFMADMDPEIEEDAFQNFEQALDDWDISDSERAEILKMLMKALHDSDRIDTMLMSLNNMRNSVKGQTILDIMSSGTEEAKAMMQEQLEFFTDFDVKDESSVTEWIKNNPDNEWDEEFYGAQKD